MTPVVPGRDSFLQEQLIVLDSIYNLIRTAEPLCTSIGGKFNTVGYVTAPSVLLPILSQDKKVTLELEVVPDNAHMTYSIIKGQEFMHDLQIDTKISTHEIIWEGTHKPKYDKPQTLV